MSSTRRPASGPTSANIRSRSTCSVMWPTAVRRQRAYATARSFSELDHTPDRTVLDARGLVLYSIDYLNMSESLPPLRSEVSLGLRANLGQFSLLVVVNAFVGAMVGMERAILPAVAEHDFQLAARAAVLSFIVVFGVCKALTNYLAGRLSDAVGRKRVLVVGWGCAEVVAA